MTKYKVSLYKAKRDCSVFKVVDGGNMPLSYDKAKARANRKNEKLGLYIVGYGYAIQKPNTFIHIIEEMK